jgi:hypothetical protein
MEEGFSVIDEVNIGSLGDIKEVRNLIPPTKDVKLRIKKATSEKNADGSFRWINMSVAVEDGIRVNGSMAFRNSVLWAKATYYADPKVYTKDFFKSKQHLLDLKKLVSALGLDINNITINDEFINSLENKVILGDIRQKMNKFTTKDGVSVEEMKNEVVNFKPVPAGSLI